MSRMDRQANLIPPLPPVASTPLGHLAVLTARVPTRVYRATLEPDHHLRPSIDVMPP